MHSDKHEPAFATSELTLHPAGTPEGVDRRAFMMRSAGLAVPVVRS
jgi:hypothetical protein